MYNFEPYDALLAIATNIAVLLMTAPGTHKLLSIENIKALFQIITGHSVHDCQQH